MLTNQPTKITNFSTIDQHLFTELAPEQAAILEGGKTLFIQQIQCVKAGADGLFGGDDDVFMSVNGSNRIVGDMDSSDTSTVNKSFDFFGDVRFELFDSDTTSANDSLGGFTATNPTNGIVSKRVSGSGSKYNVFYSVSPSTQIAPGTGTLFL